MDQIVEGERCDGSSIGAGLGISTKPVRVAIIGILFAFAFVEELMGYKRSTLASEAGHASGAPVAARDQASR